MALKTMIHRCANCCRNRPKLKPRGNWTSVRRQACRRNSVSMFRLSCSRPEPSMTLRMRRPTSQSRSANPSRAQHLKRKQKVSWSAIERPIARRSAAPFPAQDRACGLDQVQRHCWANVGRSRMGQRAEDRESKRRGVRLLCVRDPCVQPIGSRSEEFGLVLGPEYQSRGTR
jgi:hypothetical protein